MEVPTKTFGGFNDCVSENKASCNAATVPANGNCNWQPTDPFLPESGQSIESESSILEIIEGLDGSHG